MLRSVDWQLATDVSGRFPFSRASSPREKFSGVYFTKDHAVQAFTGACEQQFGRVQGDIICNKERPSQLRCTLFNPANKNL
jgi:hypothetical protein